MGEWRPYCLSKAKLIMAAQRISASSVNWVEFARKIPAAQKASFQAFKQKSDGFVRAVNALPEAAPKIDFEAYRSRIAVPGMVDDFQKKYEALQIPYPKDNATAALDAQLVAKKPSTRNLSQNPMLKLQKSKLSWTNGRKCVHLLICVLKNWQDKPHKLWVSWE